MRIPDRPWGETGADAEVGRSDGTDYRARSQDLRERLARLLAGHPSADTEPYRRNPEDLDPDHTGQDDAGAINDVCPDEESLDDEDPGDLATDDHDSRDISPGDGADKGARQLRSPVSRTWEGLGGTDHGAYRPWFSADGASDPWFAEPTDSGGIERAQGH